MLTQEQRQRAKTKAEEYDNVMCRGGDGISAKIIRNAVKTYAKDFDSAIETPIYFQSYTMRTTGKFGIL